MTDQLSSAALRLLGTRGDLLELSAIDTTILKNGAAVYVTDQNAIFALSKESAVAADGLNIVAPLQSTGRWFRQTVASLVNNDSLVPGATVEEALNNLAGETIYALESDLYLDPVNGDDSNDGLTAATAWQTRERVAQALRSPLIITASAITVHVLNDVPSGDPFFLDLNWENIGGGVLTIAGENPTTLQEGVISNWTPEDGATNQRASFTIAGVDWAAEGLLDHRIRRLSDGSVAYAQAVAGAADTVFINRPSNATGTGSVNWANGNTVRIERLTSFGGAFRAHARRDRAIIFPIVMQDIAIDEALSEIDVRWFQFLRCNVSVARLKVERPVYVLASRLAAVDVSGPSEELQFQGSWLDGVLGSLRAVPFCNIIDCSSTTQLQATSVNVNVQNLGIWEWSGAAVELRQQCTVTTTGRLFGSSAVANSYGVKVFSGTHFQYATAPNAAGAAAFDIDVGGVQNVYAALPAAGQNPGNNNAWLVVRA